MNNSIICKSKITKINNLFFNDIKIDSKNKLPKPTFAYKGYYIVEIKDSNNLIGLESQVHMFFQKKKFILFFKKISKILKKKFCYEALRFVQQKHNLNNITYDQILYFLLLNNHLK